MDYEKQFYEVDDYAGFILRLVAYIIDAIALNIVSMFLMYTFVGDSFMDMAAMGPAIEDEMTPEMALGMGASIMKMSAASLVMTWLYFAAMHSSKYQATLGKMAVSIKVTDMNGDPISFGRATGRFFGKLISSMILLIGFIMAAFTEKKQGLHDMIASTLVLKKDAPPLA